MSNKIQFELEVNGVKSTTQDLSELQKKLSETKSEIADKTVGLFGGSAGQLAQGFNSLKSGLKMAVTGFQTLRGAIMSTGIGALIVAFGVLLTYFTKSNEGTKILKQATAALGAVMGVLTDKVAALGKWLVDAFSNPKKALKELGEFVKSQLINRFTAFGKILEGIINLDFKKVTDGVIQAGTGIENATDKAKEFAKSLGDAAKKGLELEKAQQRLRTATREWSVQQAELLGQLEQLRKSAEDQSLSQTERLANLKKAGELEQKIHSKNLQLATEELRIVKEKNAISDSSEDDLDAETEAAKKVAELQAKSLSLKQEIKNKESALIKDLNNQRAASVKEQKALTEKQNKEAKEAAEKAAQEAKDAQEKAAADRIKAVERQAVSEKLILLKKLESNQVTEEQFNKQAQQLQLEHLERMKLELESQGKDAITIETEIAQKKVDINKAAQDEITKAAEDAAEKQRAAVEKTFADIQEIVGGASQIISGFKEYETALVETENQKQLDDLRARTEQELSSTELSEDQKNTIRENAKAQEESIIKDGEAKKKEIQKKSADIEFAISAASIIANTAQAIVKSVAASPLTGGLPFSAIAGVIGATQLMAANQQRMAIKQMRRGGIVEGPSHENGGVKYALGGQVTELEGGEGIINKRSMRIPGIRAMASKLNELGGGVRFAFGGITPSTQYSPQPVVNSAQADTSPIKVVVLESEITNTQKRTGKIQTRATIG